VLKVQSGNVGSRAENSTPMVWGLCNHRRSQESIFHSSVRHGELGAHRPAASSRRKMHCDSEAGCSRQTLQALTQPAALPIPKTGAGTGKNGRAESEEWNNEAGVHGTMLTRSDNEGVQRCFCCKQAEVSTDKHSGRYRYRYRLGHGHRPQG